MGVIVYLLYETASYSKMIALLEEELTISRGKAMNLFKCSLQSGAQHMEQQEGEDESEDDTQGGLPGMVLLESNASGRVIMTVYISADSNADSN